MQKPTPTTNMPDIKKALLWLRLGESIRNYFLSRFRDDPYQSDKPKDPPEVILKNIREQTKLLQCFVASDPSQKPIRQLLGLRPSHLPRPELVQILSLLLFNDLAMRGDETADSIIYTIGVLFADDHLEGRLLARHFMAILIDRKLVTVSDHNIRASRAVHNCLTGDNILLYPGLTEFMVRTHFYNKAVAEEAKKKAVVPPPPVLTPQALFGKLKEYVVSNDSACRLLSVRGTLHLNRRQLLQNGAEAGQNECILLIGPSGTGKTYLAETFGRLCGLPFASLSASNFTATGFVGLDTDDALKSLIRNAGDIKDPQSVEKARYGVLFMDEWDKRRANNGSGVDVVGSGVQYEWLKLISGTKMVLGARRYERDEQQIEFNSQGTFFCFAGAFSGLEKIIGRIDRDRSGMGFGGGVTLSKAPMVYDALAEYGLVPEFLNRVTAVIAMKPLNADDIAEIAVSPHGSIQTFNQILAPQGISITVDPAGLRELAEFCVDTRLYARGIGLVISAIVEDFVFNEAKGAHVIPVQTIRQAIEQIANVERIGGC